MVLMGAVQGAAFTVCNMVCWDNERRLSHGAQGEALSSLLRILCRALGEWLLERFAELADMRILRAAEVLLKSSAAGVQQTAEYSVQAEFGLLAASLYRQLDPVTASHYKTFREMTIGEVNQTLHSVRAAVDQAHHDSCSYLLVGPPQHIGKSVSRSASEVQFPVPYRLQILVLRCSGLSLCMGLQMMVAACGWMCWQPMEQLCGSVTSF